MNNTEPIFKSSKGPMNVVVFISGSGTNLKALCEEERNINNKTAQLWQLSLVFTNVHNCEGIKIANSYNKNVISLSSKKFFDMLEKNPDNDVLRNCYDAAVISLIEQFCTPDLIVLAGYRRKLSDLFYKRFKNKILNLYPGDITKPYLVTGIDASLQAIKHGEKMVKASVYIDQPYSRFGLPILQSDYVSLENYTEDDRAVINKKIREEAEWVIFPYTITNLIANGKISIDKYNMLYYNNKKIPANGLQFSKLKE